MIIRCKMEEDPVKKEGKNRCRGKERQEGNIDDGKAKRKEERRA